MVVEENYYYFLLSFWEALLLWFLCFCTLTFIKKKVYIINKIFILKKKELISV